MWEGFLFNYKPKPHLMGQPKLCEHGWIVCNIEKRFHPAMFNYFSYAVNSNNFIGWIA